MSKHFAPHLVARQHGAEIEWPVLEAEDGQKAVVCFTQAKRAQEYLEGQSAQAPGWSVVQMEWEEFLRWLRSNLVNGVHLLVVNPKSNEDLVRALSICSLLVDVEDGALANPFEALDEQEDIGIAD